INPAAGLAPTAEEKPRERVLSDAELRAFWAALNDRSGLMRPPRREGDKPKPVYLGRSMAIAIQLCALLLQRRQEIAGMRLDELDLNQGTWTIPAARMKAGQPHVVPLPAHAISL